MADHSKPTLTSNYTAFVDEIKARLDDISKGFDPAKTSPTNVPVDTIRWVSSSRKWQRWSGTAWVDIASTFAIDISGSAAKLATARNIALTGGATGSASFDGSANTSINVTALNPSQLSSPVPLNKGGTGGTSATQARTNLGLGTAATSDVTQTTGQSTTNVMSQKAVTDELVLKADTSNLGTAAASNVVQATGQSTSDVMSQKAVSDELALKVDTDKNIVLGTPVTLSGQTVVDFTGIPATAKRVTLTFIDTKASNNPILLLGSETAFQEGHYIGSFSALQASSVATTNPPSTSILLFSGGTEATVAGKIVLERSHGNTWGYVSDFGYLNGPRVDKVVGRVGISSGTLSRLRLTTETAGQILVSGVVVISWE